MKEFTLFENYPEILTAEQLMEMLQIGKVLTYKLITDKKIKAVKIGREYKIVKASVINYILSDEEVA